jgi:hypothetical protein
MNLCNYFVKIYLRIANYRVEAVKDLEFVKGYFFRKERLTRLSLPMFVFKYFHSVFGASSTDSCHSILFDLTCLL